MLFLCDTPECQHLLEGSSYMSDASVFTFGVLVFVAATLGITLDCLDPVAGAWCSWISWGCTNQRDSL